MSVGKRAALGAAVIVVVFGAAMVLVDRLLSEPAGAPPPRQEPPQLAAPPPPPLEAPPPPDAPARPPQPQQAAPPAPAGAPASIPVPQGKDLLTTLDAARARILECGGVDPELARPGGAPRRGPGGQDPKHPRTILLLDLEPLQGELAVRGIEVVSVGGQDGEDLIRCARQELTGRVFEATAAKPGKHMKMQFVIDRARR